MVGVEMKIPRTPKYNVDFFFAALPTMSQRPSMRVLNIVSGGREAEQKLRLISEGVVGFKEYIARAPTLCCMSRIFLLGPLRQVHAQAP